MSYVVKKYNEINTEVCESTILLKRNIKLKTNLLKKSVRYLIKNYLFIQSSVIPILYVA